MLQRYLARARPTFVLINSAKDKNNNYGKNNKGSTSRMTGFAAVAGGFTTLAMIMMKKNKSNHLKALEADMESAESEQIEKENRLRQFGTLNKIFDFFATYRYQDEKTGSTMALMSVKDFYNSVTPGKLKTVNLQASQGLGLASILVQWTPLNGTTVCRTFGFFD